MYQFEDQRKSPRKVLKVRARLAIDGQSPLMVRTVDIGANGVSVSVPEPIAVGQGGQVAFELLIDGKATPIAARVKVVHCIFGSGEFRVGVQFLNLELGAMSQLARFMR